MKRYFTGLGVIVGSAFLSSSWLKHIGMTGMLPFTISTVGGVVTGYLYRKWRFSK